ncbi:hypothetical protein EDB84DRAFT_1576635 [Lactarius hengduanensis]|nr:hypothetical protein EDB84DRAFT_1576635 [Lactarius hengduanensis]
MPSARSIGQQRRWRREGLQKLAHCSCSSGTRSSLVEVDVSVPANVESLAHAPMDVCEPSDPELDVGGVELSLQDGTEERSTSVVEEPSPAGFALQMGQERGVLGLMRAEGVRFDEEINAHYLGRMDSECRFCCALHWVAERRVGSPVSNPQYGSCCLRGKVQIDFVARLPDVLYGLYSSDSAQAKEFRLHLRRYNKVFAFTSTGGSGRLDGTMFNGRGPPSYKIQGEVFHQIGPLSPEENQAPLYSQLYIYNPADALERRNDNNRVTRPATMSLLQDVILSYHPFIEVYKQAQELLTSTDLPEYYLKLDFLPVAATSTFGLQVPTPPSYGAQELPCPIATLRHRRGMRASPRRYDSDTASQRHDCDAVPQRHDCDAVPQRYDCDAVPQRYDCDAVPQRYDCDAVPQRYDCDAVPQRYDCDAVPQRYDCDAVPQRYDCDAVPQRYDCDAVPQRYDCDAVPRRHDCDAVPRRYDCDAVPQHHDCDAAPQHHDCDMALAPQRYDSDVAPQRYNSDTAPQRHDCGRAAQHSDTPSRRDEDSNTTRGATTATRRRGVTKTATRRAALRQRRGAAAWRRQRHGEDNDTVPQHGEDGDTAPWPLVYKSIVTVLSYT